MTSFSCSDEFTLTTKVIHVQLVLTAFYKQTKQEEPVNNFMLLADISFCLANARIPRIMPKAILKCITIGDTSTYVHTAACSEILVKRTQVFLENQTHGASLHSLPSNTSVSLSSTLSPIYLLGIFQSVKFHFLFDCTENATLRLFIFVKHECCGKSIYGTLIVEGSVSMSGTMEEINR